MVKTESAKDLSVKALLFPPLNAAPRKKSRQSKSAPVVTTTPAAACCGLALVVCVARPRAMQLGLRIGRRLEELPLQGNVVFAAACSRPRLAVPKSMYLSKQPPAKLLK